MPPPALRVEDRVMEQEIVYEKLPTDIAERWACCMCCVVPCVLGINRVAGTRAAPRLR